MFCSLEVVVTTLLTGSSFSLEVLSSELCSLDAVADETFDLFCAHETRQPNAKTNDKQIKINLFISFLL